MDINILPNNEILKLSDSCFNVDYKKTLVHQVITSYFSNGRENIASQKNRSAVRGGGKKPWRQKGTGRARAGTTRGPIWRGGGVTFATGKRNYSEKINKKMYRKAMACIFSELRRSKRLYVIDKLELKKPKTKDMQALISGLGLSDVLFVTHEVSANEYLASRNLYHVDIRDCLDVDPVSLVAFETVVITQEALKYFEGLV